MRCVRSGLTFEVPLRNAETVAIETPAASATSIIVGAFNFLPRRPESCIFRNVLMFPLS
jgi:hypothetical protein